MSSSERLGHQRRGLLVLALATASTAVLGGCGFALRQPPHLPFRTLQLTGFRPHSPLADDLRHAIEASPDTRVVPGLPEAQAVLEATTDRRDVTVVANTSSGQVTELQLRARFTFMLRTRSGHVLIPPTDIFLSRDMTYTESAALAKEEEQEVLFRGMQSDIVDQVLRRLATVSLPS